MHQSTPSKPLWSIESIRAGNNPRWNYIDGCMITAFLCLIEITHVEKNFNFSEKFIDYYIDDEGSILGYSMEKYSLVNEGRVLFDLYKRTGKEKYKKTILKLFIQLKNQPHTVIGNF